MTTTPIEKVANGDIYLQYTFPIITRIDRYSFRTEAQGTLPRRWNLESIDSMGKSTILHSNVQATVPNEDYSFNIVPPVDVSAVRLNILETDGDHVRILNFRLFSQPGEFTKYIIPFCTDMSSQYHTGSLNGAQVDSMELKLSRPVPATFYGLSHNILRFENGMASLGW
jgi:hypothetical protein